MDASSNHLFYAILVFIIIFAGTCMIKPLFLYNRDGSLKEFGVGYKNKTFMPLWLFSIILGILVYTFSRYLTLDKDLL